MPKKLDRCVKKVEKKNKEKPESKKVNPWAVCKAAISGKRKKKK